MYPSSSLVPQTSKLAFQTPGFFVSTRAALKSTRWFTFGPSEELGSGELGSLRLREVKDSNCLESGQRGTGVKAYQGWAVNLNGLGLR